MGLHNLPSKSWQINEAWMLSANLAADLDAWLRLLTLHDQQDLADAEPDTMRLGSTTSRPASRNTPAAVGYGSNTPAPGPTPSPPPGGD